MTRDQLLDKIVVRDWNKLCDNLWSPVREQLDWRTAKSESDARCWRVQAWNFIQEKVAEDSTSPPR